MSNVEASVSLAKCRSPYLFWLLLLLPIDWFEPTGILFREFGAKPASILITLGGLYGLIILRPASREYYRRELWLVVVFFLVIFLNMIAFSSNIILNWSDFNGARSPLVQFVTQTLLIFVAFLALLGNFRFFSRIEIEAALIFALPRAAITHLFFWCLETTFPEIIRPILSDFRVNGVFIERASGLMSEPSYYGTMAALFAIPLLLAPQFHGKNSSKILAAGLLVSAITVSAKTMVIVAGTQVLFLLLFGRLGRAKALIVFILLSATAIFFIQTRSALNLEQNLSSINRIGSVHLAANVAASERSFIGIGAGQFHFQYRAENAPTYLFASDEAISQMSSDANTRASTYNFPLRVFVELGVVGFLLVFIGIIYLLFIFNRKLILAQMLLLGSLGFLLTQDTYMYPPLILSCSLIIAGLQPRIGSTR